MVGKQCGGIGPAPRPDSPLAHAAVLAFDHAADAWQRVQPSEALEATWRLIRAMNAELEATEPWKAEPGPAVDGVLGDALEVLRIVAVLASPAVPEREPGDLAAHRASGFGARPAAAERGRVGRVSGRPAGREGRRRCSRASPCRHRRDVTWTDNHCHLDDERMAGGASVAIAAARAAGVDRMITIGTDATRSRMAIDIAAAHDGVWATVGLHPHDAKEGVDTIVPLLDEPGVVAIGECGLDYHYDNSPRDVQRAAFAAQIALAHARALPLVIHTREAWDDTFDILAVRGRAADHRVPLLHRWR